MEIYGEDILFSNFNYNPEIYYFLYVGDLKAYTLNYFVTETLQRRIRGREVRFLAIVPDVCLQYNYANIVVINPVASADMIANHTFSESEKPPVMSCRVSSGQFMTAVSRSSAVRRLIGNHVEHRWRNQPGVTGSVGIVRISIATRNRRTHSSCRAR